MRNYMSFNNNSSWYIDLFLYLPSSILLNILKVHNPIFQNSSFSALFEALSLHVNLKFQSKWSSHLDVQLQLPVSYCVSLIMVTITKQTKTHIHT